jgi:hypothetical protein
MASIYKREGSNIWQCAFYVPDPQTGKTTQVRKSTGCTSRAKAQVAAVKLEQEARKQAGAGEDRSQRIQAVLVKAGEEAIRETLNAARARQYMSEILRISTGEDLPSFSVKSWLEEWHHQKAKVASKPTAARYKASVNAFVDWLGNRSEKPLESITIADTLTKDALTKDTLKIEDVSRFKEALKQTFSENPGGYANEIDRFIVQRWTVRPEPDLPPFCCWKDESISDYLAEKAGKAKGWGAKFIEDRRSALGLLKIPAFIVVEWKQGSQGNRGMPGFDLGLRDNPKLDLDALRWICGRLDFEIFCDAFPQDEEFLQRAKQFLQLPISDSLRSDIGKRVQMIRAESEGTTS